MTCVRRALALSFRSSRRRHDFITHSRALSTDAGARLAADIAGALAPTQPCFGMAAEDVTVLAQPRQFYCKLLDMIRGARRHIFLSSLYIGDAEHELIGTLSMALASNESLRLTLALDANRSTRPGAPPAVLPLVRAYPDRVRAALFRSPALKPPLSWVVPRRFDEGWGTWHAKLYGADDAVLISGANLSKDYFTARQDRYVHFRAPALASFCAGFLDEAAGWSYRLGPDGALVWPADAPPEGRFERHAGSGLRGYMKRARQVHSPAATDGADVRVYPVPQLGQFGIGDEAMAMSALLHADGAADLTSGYFGLAPGYAALVRGDVRVLCAAPRANGFFGARGVAGRVPEAYTLLEQRFARGAAPGVCMHEWAREGWTYHAKGVWARPARGVPPVATLLGSTNLSARSAALDAEMSVVMLSTHERVRAALGQEVDGLWEHAAPWRGNERRVRLGTRALVGLVGEML